MATTASAATPINVDLLTVSGRFEAPRAIDGPLKARIKVVQADLEPGDAAVFLVEPASLDLALKAGFEASLRNFGYLAAPDLTDTLSIQVHVDRLEMTPDKDGVTAVARLHVTSQGEGEACVPRIAEAKYHAYAPIKAGGGQRAVGIAAIVIFAAVGLDASQFAVSQFTDASAQDRAMNARRVRTESEGVSPQGGDKQMARYAAVNATQLAAADFVRQLGKGACAAPSAGPVPPPAPATSSAPGAAS